MRKRMTIHNQFTTSRENRILAASCMKGAHTWTEKNSSIGLDGPVACDQADTAGPAYVEGLMTLTSESGHPLRLFVSLGAQGAAWKLPPWDHPYVNPASHVCGQAPNTRAGRPGQWWSPPSSLVGSLPPSPCQRWYPERHAAVAAACGRACQGCRAHTSGPRRAFSTASPCRPAASHTTVPEKHIFA